MAGELSKPKGDVRFSICGTCLCSVRLLSFSLLNISLLRFLV